MKAPFPQELKNGFKQYVLRNIDKKDVPLNAQFEITDMFKKINQGLALDDDDTDTTEDLTQSQTYEKYRMLHFESTLPENWLKELELRRERDLSTARSTVAGRESKERSRLEALRHYSDGKMCCADCGEQNVDLLTFYHPTESYKEDSEGLRIVGYLKKNNYPSGYKVICMNCSMKRRINEE